MRRLGEGKSAAEREILKETLGDIFGTSKQFETDGEREERLQPAPAKPRELIDRPDANGIAPGPRTGDHVYDVPIVDGLKAMLRDNPELLTAFQQAAASWGEASHNPQPGDSTIVYADITDGAYFKEHPELGVNADRSDGSLRLGFILYYDEVEVVNALGAFTGTHKIGLFYWGLLNIDAHQRMDLNNIHLATIVLDCDVSYYGIEQVVSGIPSEPNYPEGTSIGASLRALHDGVTLHVGREGNFAETLTRGWLVVVSADFPAAAVLTGTMVGTTANRFCRECEVDRREAGFDCPCSLLHPTATPALRSAEARSRDMTVCGNDATQMASAGWTSWSDAFMRCGPHFDITRCLPYDLMHGEAEGLLKGELAHFIFYCVRIAKFFTLDQLNHQTDAYAFPGGGKVPYFTENLLDGKRSGCERGRKPSKQGTKGKRTASNTPMYVPQGGAHVHLTSGQTLLFSIHSPQIFKDLGVDPDDPAFECWLTHLSYLCLLMQHSITYEDVCEIDRLVGEHQRQL